MTVYFEIQPMLKNCNLSITDERELSAHVWLWACSLQVRCLLYSCYSMAECLSRRRCLNQSVFHRCGNQPTTFSLPHMRCGGKMFNRIWLQWGLHVLSQSTSEQLYFKSLFIPLNMLTLSPTWVPKVCIMKTISPGKSFIIQIYHSATLTLFYWIFDLPSQFYQVGVWTM